MILLDKIILGFIAIGAVTGLFRGFFREIVGTIGVLVAAISANLVSPQVRHWAELVTADERTQSFLAWISIFVLVMIALKLLSLLLENLFKALQMGWMNRLAGAAFGAIKYMLIVAVLVTFAEFCYGHLPFLGGNPECMQDSTLIPHIHRLVHTLYYNITT